MSSASIVDSASPGEVCLSCQYVSNSLARGCEIEVNNNEFEEERYRGVLLIDDVEECVAVRYGGSFTINVYDINSDGTRSAGPAVVFNDVTIDDPVSPSPSTTILIGTLTHTHYDVASFVK